MEGSEITAERLDYVIKAWQQGRMVEHVFCAFLGEPPREDFVPYVADFYLQLEDVQWTIVSGVVNDTFVVSVRNLGYSRNAGDFVRRWFNDIGSAGGHRTMAKAVVPLEAFQRKFGTYEGCASTSGCWSSCSTFLHEVKNGSGNTKGTKADTKVEPAAKASPSARRRVRQLVQAIACVRSSIRSAGSSRPIEMRIIPRVTPADASCASSRPVCDVRIGRLQMLSTPPRLAARLTSPQPVEGTERRRSGRPSRRW